MSARQPDPAAAFRTAFGGAPEGVWTAPGRVNLIGEHTDYNEGFALPAAIDLGCQVAARRRGDGVLRLHSVQAGGAPDIELAGLTPGTIGGWAAYAAGTAWALGACGVALAGADLLIDSDVPSGAGLSSSAALECAVGLALCELAGSALAPTQLALAGQRAETDVVGAPVGVMDQMASMHGRAGHAVCLDCRSLEVDLVPVALAERGLVLLVIDTRVTHAHATGGYASRRQACEQAARILGVGALRDATPQQVEAAAAELGDERYRRARHVVTENARVLQAVACLRAGDIAGLGPLLAAGHTSLREDFEVSCAELDLAVDAALDAGALAARMTGGGFGGSVVVIAADTLVDDVARACARSAQAAGAPVPVVRRVALSDGARRTA